MDDVDDLKTRKVHTTKQRKLTDDDENKIKDQDKRMVSSFKAQQLEENAKKLWDQFYNRNKTNFFKDRHWTTREFNELVGDTDSERHRTMLEVGCGVGNLLFPLIQENSLLQFYACDFSPKAVQFVKEHELFNAERIKVFQADVTTKELEEGMNGACVDIITMVFVLSAIHPDKFLITLQNIYRILNSGGVVLFRDYGIYDMTQIRFKHGNKIGENFYMRQDGTRSYFFKLEELSKLFVQAGFQVMSCCYVETKTVNRKEQVDVPRVFVQGKFLKT